jgi:hypothetical protein
MRNMKEHVVWAVTSDKSVVCLGILEDVETGEFFPVHGSYAAVGAAKVRYKEDGNYTAAEGVAIAEAGAALRSSLGSFWFTLASAHDPLKASTLKEAVRERLS